MAELGVDIKKPINGAPPVFVAALNDRGRPATAQRRTSDEVNVRRVKEGDEDC